MGYAISEELREKKRAAGRAGSKARMETITRAKAAEKASRDHHLDEATLQDEIHKLRELGSKYDEFIDLEKIVLSGILWNKRYPQLQDLDSQEFAEDTPLIDRKYFQLSPDWCCQQMIRIGRSEFPLPEGLVHFEIRVFQAFLDWASGHLTDRLDGLAAIATELETRKLGKETFSQELHDRVIREDSYRKPEYKQPVVVPDNKPTKLQQWGFDDPIIPRTPFLDVSTYDNNVSPQALDYLLHGRRG